MYIRVGVDDEHDDSRDGGPVAGGESDSRKPNFPLATNNPISSFEAEDVESVGNTTRKSDFSFISSGNLTPLSKPPSRWRDFTFFIAFLIHFFLMTIFDLIPDAKEGDTVIPHMFGGLWISMVMTVAVVGMALGVIIVFILTSNESRESFLHFSLLNSLVVKILLTVYFFLSKSLLGILIGIIFILKTLVHLGRIKKLKENVNFTSALIGLSIDICTQYGTALVSTCCIILFVQTCVLLMWGVYLVGLLDDISIHLVELFGFLMVFSLYWTIQLFESILSYIVGGCVCWYFLRSEDEEIDSANRVSLYAFNAITSSFGTICKGSLLCGPSHSILLLSSWARPRQHTLSNTGNPQRSFSVRHFVSQLTNPVLSFAKSNIRLAIPLAASYGTTLSSSAESHLQAYPNALELILDDTSRATIAAVVEQTAGFIALSYGFIFGMRNETSAAAVLFVTLVYIFTYAGVSLAIQVFQSSVTALMTIYSIQPNRLANENQIIFLRYFRTSESELRW